MSTKQKSSKLKSDNAPRRVPTPATNFVKNDDHKLRYDLIPPEAMDALARALTHGAKKYAPDNWRKCEEPWRYVRAAMGHINAYNAGKWIDEDSGNTHLDHAIASLAMLIGIVTSEQNGNIE